MLEIEYDQFNSNQYNDDCDDCDPDPYLIQASTPGSKTCWAAGSAPTAKRRQPPHPSLPQLMSKVDDVFDFADELIDEWGHYVTFVRKENSVYDPETGATTETETRQQVKVVISKLDISRVRRACTKQNDVKIILDPVQVNYIYITDQDYFLVPRENAPDEMMKVIESCYLPRRQTRLLRHHREAAVMARRRTNIKIPGLTCLDRQHQKRAKRRMRLVTSSSTCKIARTLVLVRRICQANWVVKSWSEPACRRNQRNHSFLPHSAWRNSSQTRRPSRNAWSR